MSDKPTIASMRPPQNAGGIRDVLCGACNVELGFNEAPAKRGGDWLMRLTLWLNVCCFNEAPAKRGGDYRLRRHLREVVG